MAIATKTVPLLRIELEEERDSKEEFIVENIRLEALNKKLSSQQVLDKDNLNKQILENIKLKDKNMNNLLIGGAIGILSTSIVLILLN